MKIFLLLICVAMATASDDLRLSSPSFTRFMEKYDKKVFRCFILLHTVISYFYAISSLKIDV